MKGDVIFFLKPFFFFVAKVCIFLFAMAIWKAAANYRQNGKAGKVLGIYTEINDDSMMVMTPDSQI